MYLEKIKGRYKCADETLQELIDVIDVDSMEAEENNITEIRVIDPPIINGIKLTEHPNEYQRNRYRKIFDAGGIVCQVFINGVASYMVTDIKGKIGRSVAEFDPVRTDEVKRKVSRRIMESIDTEFEPVRKKANGRIKKRPKNMKPADFWAQFNSVELQKINNSEIQEVKDFVVVVNESNNLNLNMGFIKNGIELLNLNLLLSHSTYAELTDV